MSSIALRNEGGILAQKAHSKVLMKELGTRWLSALKAQKGIRRAQPSATVEK
jgi:hypothetical protein